MPKRSTIVFTLIELMVTVAIIALLATIALPSYQEYVLKSRRAGGKDELLEAQKRMERAYTDLNSYASAVPSIQNASGVIGTSEGGYYQVTSASATVSTYTLDSTPQGGQAYDKCKTLTLTETGAKSVAPTTGIPPTFSATECW